MPVFAVSFYMHIIMLLFVYACLYRFGYKQRRRKKRHDAVVSFFRLSLIRCVYGYHFIVFGTSSVPWVCAVPARSTHIKVNVIVLAFLFPTLFHHPLCVTVFKCSNEKKKKHKERGKNSRKWNSLCVCAFRRRSQAFQWISIVFPLAGFVLFIFKL